MKTKILTTVALLISCFTSSAFVRAENPTSATLKFVVANNADQEPGALKALTLRLTQEFDTALEAGANCVVEIRSCVSVFVPSGLAGDPDTRNCEPYTVGTVTIDQGEKKFRYVMKAKPMKFRSGRRSRQISFQTSSLCTDSMANQTSFDSSPKARKASRHDNLGITPAEFNQALSSSLRRVY